MVATNSGPNGSSNDPFQIRQGEPLVILVTFSNDNGPLDITDYTGTTQIRTGYSDGEVEPVAEGVVTILEDTMGASQRGVAQIFYAPSITEYPQIVPGRYVVDARLIHDSDPDARLMSGLYYVEIEGAITR